MEIFYEKTHQPQARQRPTAAPVAGVSPCWALAFLWPSRNSIFKRTWKFAVLVLWDQLYYLISVKIICCLAKAGGQPYSLPSSSLPAFPAFPSFPSAASAVYSAACASYFCLILIHIKSL